MDSSFRKLDVNVKIVLGASNNLCFEYEKITWFYDGFCQIRSVQWIINILVVKNVKWRDFQVYQFRQWVVFYY